MGYCVDARLKSFKPNAGAEGPRKRDTDEVRYQAPLEAHNKALEKELVDFCANFNDERLESKECIAYLIKYATAKAQILEEKVKAIRMTDWKQHVAGNAQKSSRGA